MIAIDMPDNMQREDGTARFAYVTFVMMNDSYVPGALLMAYGLRRQWTEADLVCMVTPEITADAREALSILFDRVIEVETVYVPHKRSHERRDRPFWFTRQNAFRLGADGDLGTAYDKIVVLDADVLPMKWFDHLFTLDTPSGVMNESKEHCIEEDEEGQYIVPPHLNATTQWRWHEIYAACPHGQAIPQEITDRVASDPRNNTGVSGSLYVWEPSMREYLDIRETIAKPPVLEYVNDRFDYPDMQYMTMRYSGRWQSVDLRFIGFKGYPGLPALFGTHYAGFKPWYFNQPQILKRYGLYEDFAYWYREYLAMVWVDYPELRQIKRLARLERDVRELTGSEIGTVVESPSRAAALPPPKRPQQVARRGQNPPTRGRRAKNKRQGGKKSRRRG
ncbi:MAG: glycosyltransferase [Candidatus Latescibacterota bacterium]|nr:glycosyltransferase [Candidatus Latescibacterota bacterium]